MYEVLVGDAKPDEREYVVRPGVDRGDRGVGLDHAAVGYDPSQATAVNIEPDYGLVLSYLYAHVLKLGPEGWYVVVRLRVSRPEVQHADVGLDRRKVLGSAR